MKLYYFFNKESVTSNEGDYEENKILMCNVSMGTIKLGPTIILIFCLKNN